MADKSKTVIVKKIKKGHEGHHGGSWKVAYADFVTAMMAFFLLMWLLAMVSPEKRAAISEYFKHFSLFEKAGRSFMQESSQIFQQAGKEAKTSATEFGKGPGEMSAEDFKQRLKKAIDEKLQDLKDQVMVDTVEGGVRIQLVDTEGRPMFLSGSTELSSNAKEILSFVSENIKDMPNKIAVEGHTDASPLKKGQITNWELSTGRASTARRELESRGIDPNRVARVVGYADTQLLFKDKPKDSRNRRISIILLNEKVSEPAKPSEEKVVKPEVVQPAQPLEQVNKPVLEKEKPVPKQEQTPIKPEPSPKIIQPVQPAEKVKKPLQEKPAPKQEQKKGIIETDIGVKPKKPIDINKPLIAPPVGK